MIAERPNLIDQFVAARGHVLAFVLAATRDVHVAEDVVQELSVHVLRQAARGVVPADPFAWLLGTARHRVADHYRATQRDARRRARMLELADAAHAAFLDHPPCLEATAGECDDPRLSHLRACLERLTPKARAMLDARYAQSKPIEAIAAAVSWAPDSVKVALAKARKALGECVRRKLLAAGGDDA